MDGAVGLAAVLCGNAVSCACAVWTLFIAGVEAKDFASVRRGGRQ